MSLVMLFYLVFIIVVVLYAKFFHVLSYVLAVFMIFLFISSYSYNNIYCAFVYFSICL